tara:strand:+ start:231 stop:497 length:267 start_codon:yes stop_codon:yes gene_type:complete
MLDMGIISATQGAVANYDQPQMAEYLIRHAYGDWGDVPPEDDRANDQALKDGSRLVSSYDGGKLWIITEAEDATGKRHATTLLLPEEY